MKIYGALPRRMPRSRHHSDPIPFFYPASVFPRGWAASHSSFRVSGAPSNNKGWKSCYFFVSCSQGWGFSLRWLDQVIKNSYPGLSNDEYKQLGCLKEILSTSRVVMGITEEWLVETGLSPAPRADMVNLKQMRGMPRASSAPRPRQSTASSVGDSDRPGNSELDRLRKKPKIGTSKMSESIAALVSATKSGSIPREQSHRSTPNEEAVGSGRSKEHARKAGSAKAARPASVCDLCCTRARIKDEPFQALFIG
ncbi:unnamed protein product, partial [Musa acuminata subsp. burmannicoides]